MPPALEPIDIQILAAVETLLSNLNSTDYYNATIPTISTEEQSIFQVRDFPAVFIVQGEMDYQEEVGGFYTVFMDVILVGMVVTHEFAGREISRLRADIFKVLSTDQQLGSLAVDGTFKRSNSVLVEGDAPLQYMEITATYQFKMYKLDPTLPGC